MLKTHWLISLIIVIAILGWAAFKHFNSSNLYLYKVISVKNWEQGKDQKDLTLSPMDNDFIHFSTKEQLQRIINKFWKNESEFFVIKIDAKKLPGKLVLESNPGGVSKYYHLYNGSIPANSIISFSKTTSPKESSL